VFNIDKEFLTKNLEVFLQIFKILLEEEKQETVNT